MLPNITNNRKSPYEISVKFMLFSLVAALLFVGMFATVIAQPPHGSSSTGHQHVAPAPANNNFLASLRFWEKNKNQQHAVQNTTQVPQNTARPPQNLQTVQAEQPVNLTLQIGGTAPEPPPIPHIESHSGIGVALMPEWSENYFGTNEKNSSTPLDIGNSRLPSYVSYSNDTRDWIESFHLQQETQEKVSTVFQPVEHHPQEMFAPVLQHEDDENNYWDGRSTKLATIAMIREEMNKLQEHQTTTVPTPSGVEPLEVSKIDLSPSYHKRLPHVQTCGVVVVQANFPLTEIVSILDEISMLQHDLTQYIGVPAAQEKIELCLFKDENSYIEFLKEFFPRAPRDRRALFVKLDSMPGTLMVQKSKEFEVDLRHEMTHAIIHASISRVPIWLDEGLAKYFEVPPQDRAGKHPYMAGVRRDLRLGMIPSLDKLTKLETIDDMGVKEYRDSWAWTHFLIHRSSQTHRLLAGYLQMLAKYPGTEEGYTGNVFALGERTFGISVTRGRERPSPVPSLKLYLDDVLKNQRESFRDHFETVEK